ARPVGPRECHRPGGGGGNRRTRRIPQRGRIAGAAFLGAAARVSKASDARPEGQKRRFDMKPMNDLLRAPRRMATARESEEKRQVRSVSMKQARLRLRVLVLALLLAACGGGGGGAGSPSAASRF